MCEKAKIMSPPCILCTTLQNTLYMYNSATQIRDARIHSINYKHRERIYTYIYDIRNSLNWTLIIQIYRVFNTIGTIYSRYSHRQH